MYNSVQQHPAAVRSKFNLDQPIQLSSKQNRYSHHFAVSGGNSSAASQVDSQYLIDSKFQQTVRDTRSLNNSIYDPQRMTVQTEVNSKPWMRQPDYRKHAARQHAGRSPKDVQGLLKIYRL